LWLLPTSTPNRRPVSQECPLHSVLVVPLHIANDVIGTIQLFEPKNKKFVTMNKTLGEGITRLLSNQRLLARYELQKTLLVQSELKLLQAQVNPHFLFNALNTIIAILRFDAARGKELLIHLSNFFRKNLKRVSDLSTLEEELDQVNSYLQIEKARFDDRLTFEIDIDPALLLETGEFSVAGKCADAPEAIRAINRTKPDVLFLDVQMPVIDGFELLGMIDEAIMPVVVFVTAYDAYALKAFEENAFDYLLKPVAPERLAKTVEKLKKRFSSGIKPVLALPDIKKIPCLHSSRIKLIQLPNVEQVRSGETGVYVICAQGEFYTDLTLQALEDKTELVRCHKQFLVNIDLVDEITLRENGAAEIRTKSGRAVPPSAWTPICCSPGTSTAAAKRCSRRSTPPSAPTLSRFPMGRCGRSRSAGSRSRSPNPKILRA